MKTMTTMMTTTTPTSVGTLVTVSLMRHCESIKNLAKVRGGKTKENRHIENLTVRFDPAFIDCGLSENGLEQCLRSRAEIMKDDYEIVFTSPMKRCLETTAKLFENHPSKPKIFVVPSLKEMMKSSCDIPSDLNEIKRLFPSFDYTHFSEYEGKKLWAVEECGENRHTMALKALLQDEHDQNKMLDYIRAIHPETLEDVENTKKRVAKAQRIVKATLATESKRGGKVLIVAHGIYFSHFIAETKSLSAPLPAPEEGAETRRSFGNGEIFEHTF